MVLVRLMYPDAVKALCLCKKMFLGVAVIILWPHLVGSRRVGPGPPNEFPLLISEIPPVQDSSTSALMTFGVGSSLSWGLSWALWDV